jgi:hypothetical protein
MTGILRAITNTATTDIECGADSGIWVRVRKVRSADLAQVGIAALSLLPSASTDDTNGAEAEPVDPMAALAEMGPDKARKLLGYQEGMVCAAMIAVQDPDTKKWEPCTIVMDPNREDPDNGRVWVGSLPQVIQSAVFEEAIRLGSDDEAALASMRGFRGKSGIAAVVG